MLAQSDRDAIEVADDLVTVSKEHKDVGRSNVAGIEIRIETDSPVPVAFRLIEQFPEGVSMDDIAVHPQYSPEKWSISETERRMVFEDIVAPDETVVTLYGILEAKYDSLEPFLGEPEIALTQRVDPGTTSDGEQPLFRGSALAMAGDDSAAEDGAIDVDRLLENMELSEAGSLDSIASESERTGDLEAADASVSEPTAKVVIGGQAESDTDGSAAAGTASEATSTASPEIPSAKDSFLFQDDASRTDEGGSMAAADDGQRSIESTAGAPKLTAGSVELGNGSVVTAFIEELQGEKIGDEKLDALKDALDLEPAESMRLRVSHLQSEVASLSAYADEFEQFVDQEGSFSDVIEEFRSELGRVDDHVDDLSADVRVAGQEREALEDHIDRLEHELSTLRESHQSSVGQLSSRIDDVESGSVDAGEVEAVREDLAAERAWRRKVVSSIESLAESASDRDLDQ